ncbi:MAG TPA: MBL fold metallo-hydrolase [Actinomycetota bacterium]|nr:MBL fold metallo-hydrolase [Actinomycetota bacterium]
MTFAGPFRIDGGDLRLDLVETPGHTEDHVSVWIPQLRLLLAGDAVEHPFPHVLLRISAGQQNSLAPLRQRELVQESIRRYRWNHLRSSESARLVQGANRHQRFHWLSASQMGP